MAPVEDPKRSGGGEIERADVAGFDMDDAVVALQLTLDQQKALARDGEAFALEEVRRKNDIGDAGFIFEREEDEAFGRAGTLAGNDATGRAHANRVGALREFRGRPDAFLHAAGRGDRPSDADR